MVFGPHTVQDQNAGIHRDDPQQIDADKEGGNQKGHVEFSDQVSRRPPAIDYDTYGNGHRQEDSKVSQGQAEEPDHSDSAMQNTASHSHPQHQPIAQDSSNTGHKQDSDGELAGIPHPHRLAFLAEEKPHVRATHDISLKSIPHSPRQSHSCLHIVCVGVRVRDSCLVGKVSIT